MLVDGVLRAVAHWHRTILVGGTALLAIGATEVTPTHPPLRAWLWLVGGMMLLYVSDVGREVESTARSLSTMSKAPPKQIRSDVFQARSSRWLAVLTVVAIGLIIIGFIRMT
jgi:hypothetical protein